MLVILAEVEVLGLFGECSAGTYLHGCRLRGTDSKTRLRYTMWPCSAPHAEPNTALDLRGALTATVELVPEIPKTAVVRKAKGDSGTYPTNNLVRLVAAIIGVGWIPAGFLCLWIGEQFPRDAQLPFYPFVAVAIRYYRFAGAQRLRRKWNEWSKDRW